MLLKEDLEVRVKPLAPLEWDTNIPELREVVKEKLAKYAGLKVTEENFTQCDLVRKCCVSLRNSVIQSKKLDKAQYIKLPSDTLDAMYEELLKDIERIEKPLKEQFDEYDEVLKEELKSILREYVEEFQREYNLTPEFLNKIELKPKYFNKTQKESDTIEDIKSQFEEQKEAQKEYDSDVALIKTTIGGDRRFNEELLLSQLGFRKVSIIVTEILNQKKLFETIEEEEEEVVVVKKKKVTKEEVTVAVVELRYGKEDGKELNRFFKQHKDIKVTWVNKTT